MTYSDFASKMLLALYQETSDSREDAFLLAHLIANQYDLEYEPKWIGRLMQEWEVDGLATVQRVIDDAKPGRSLFQVEITGRGMRQVETAYGTKDGVDKILVKAPNHPDRNYLTDEDGAHLTDEDGAYLYDDASRHESVPVDSSKWTGLSADFVLTENKKVDLVRLLAEAESRVEMSGGSNSEKALVRAFIIASRTLAETPEPPVDLIWEMINRANSLSGIASLFVSILGLFI